MIKEIIAELEGEVGYEKSKMTEVSPHWPAEYAEAFIDGLKRAVEIVKEFDEAYGE